MKTSKPKNSLESIEKYFSQPIKSEQPHLRKMAHSLLWYLDNGKVRVWNNEKNQVNLWVKSAILSAFQTTTNTASSAGVFNYLDKLPIKKRYSLKGVRVVPGAVLRYGSFLESGTIAMPSFVNIGAYVGKGTMIDTWATVGSCAQVGENVHISGGVGIGGVLEPVQAEPVIIEDNVFLGSRAIIVEGVRVRKEAVIGAGVVLTASTKIIDVRGKTAVYFTKEIPERAVVIPGTVTKKFESGDFHVPCALIIGTRSDSTDKKTSLNSALRDFSIS